MTAKLHVQKAEWDLDNFGWHVILSDGYHTWQGRSFWLSFAFMLAFGRWAVDGNR
jgi:hypothetical protein